MTTDQSSRDGFSSPLTAAERKHWPLAYWPPHEFPPALGSLDQRLDILIRRHGGRIGPVRASKTERAEYLRWLRDNDPDATNPYEK